MYLIMHVYILRSRKSLILYSLLFFFSFFSFPFSSFFILYIFPPGCGTLSGFCVWPACDPGTHGPFWLMGCDQVKFSPIHPLARLAFPCSPPCFWVGLPHWPFFHGPITFPFLHLCPILHGFEVGRPVACLCAGAVSHQGDVVLYHFISCFICCGSPGGQACMPMGA